MRMLKSTFLAAAALAVSAAGAMAQTPATATTDLNIRSGPGPQYEVIGLIGVNQRANIENCIQGSSWCTVEYNGLRGWAYSDYLTADVAGQPMVVTGNYVDVGVPVTTYEDSGAQPGSAAGITTGAVGGAVVGALIGGPPGAIAGAAIGGTAGGVAGAATGSLVEPPETVTGYVRANPVDPVYLDGEVVAGAGVPDAVTLTPIPQYEYQYAYVNGQPVIIDPATRRIVGVLR